MRWLADPRADWVFVALALPFGLAFALATPPLDPADEIRHLQRAFALSEGHLLPVGPAEGFHPLVPSSLTALHPPYHFVHRDGRIDRERGRDGRIVCLHDLRDVTESLQIPLSPAIRQEIRRGGPYPTLLYVPQAAALLVGRALGLSAGSLLYLARFATLAAWIALCWLALRLIPVRKWTLMVLCLGPMSLYQGSFVTADAVNNAFALLFLAVILRAWLAPGFQLERRQGIGLVVACATLSLIKPGYGSLALLLLLIPKSRFKNQGQRLVIGAGAVVAMILCAGAWTLAMRASQGISAETPSWSNLIASLNQFPAWIEALSRHGYRIFVQYVGILGHLDVVLPRWIYNAYPLALVAVALIDRDEAPGLTIGRRFMLGVIFAAGFLMVVMLLFLAAPELKSANAYYTQGRYFIPVVPLLFVALPALRRMPQPWGPLAITAFCSTTLFVAAHTVATHYFIGTPPPS